MIECPFYTMPIIWALCFVVDVLYFGSQIAVALLFLYVMRRGWAH